MASCSFCGHEKPRGRLVGGKITGQIEYFICPDCVILCALAFTGKPGLEDFDQRILLREPVLDRMELTELLDHLELEERPRTLAALFDAYNALDPAVFEEPSEEDAETANEETPSPSDDTQAVVQRAQRDGYALMLADNFQLEDAQLLKDVPRNVCESEHVFPLQRTEGTVVLAMLDPDDPKAILDVRLRTGCAIVPVVTTSSWLKRTIARHFDPPTPKSA